MKKYRNQPGTNEKIYYILTIDDYGKMKLTFHGVDRIIEHEVQFAQNNWIVGKGLMFPPLNNPQWIKIED